MTLLITSIPVKTFGEVVGLSAAAWSGGADVVELRLDDYIGDQTQLAAFLQAEARRRWIITDRNKGAHGRLDPANADGLTTTDLLEGTPNVWCDIDLDAMHLVTAAESGERRFVVSLHDFDRLPPDLNRKVQDMLRVPNRVAAKAAYQPGDIVDSFAALDLLRSHGKELVAICMGEEGLWTRVLAKKLGAFASNCCLEESARTAEGQVALDEMKELFRWDELDRNTRVFGVIGDPVAQSMSPRLFRHWFGQAGINSVYLPLRVRAENRCLPRFLDKCARRPWLDIGGFSVTAPHKTAALEWLGSRSDRMSAGIGSVNTLVFRDGEVSGYNTDCYAAMESLRQALGGSLSEFRELPVDVFGAGGSARAVISGLVDLGADVTVYSRRENAAGELATTFGCKAAPWDDRLRAGGRVLINCTPVGMWPGGVQATPMPAESLNRYRVVFDLIYNPLQTKLLADAKAAGAQTLNGLDMFVRQAAMQFALWTGAEPERSSAGELVRTAIDRIPALG